MSGALAALVAAELDEPADPRARAMAAAIAARYPDAARAVLFYGSCLRERQLEGLMLDFYLIVSDYDAAYGKGFLTRANRLIPPNVFPFEHDGLAAKYAVLSEADFDRLCSARADTVSVWARFAQPARLVWAADGEAREAAIRAIAQAAPTLLRLALPAASDAADPVALWEAGFALTYGAELRAERQGRSASIVESDPARYRAFHAAALADGALPTARRATAAEQAAHARLWRGLRRRGKTMTLLRLAKASFTFAGGIDYLAWKINRHAGTHIAIRPWQRRWPLLGALTLLPRLLASRAVR